MNASDFTFSYLFYGLNQMMIFEICPTRIIILALHVVVIYCIVVLPLESFTIFWT